LGYQLTSTELAERLAEYNPIDLLKSLASYQVKLFHVRGDNDHTVPLNVNSEELWRRYEALVGEVQIEVVVGGRHVPGPQYHESKRKLAFLFGGQ